jgi:hypothetical protein
MEQKAMFLGAESLAGSVVTLCYPAIIENLDEDHLTPAAREEFEKSAAAFPILYAGRIAGVFLVSSTQYNFFLSQARSALVQKYADLIALAFEQKDFYEPRDIGLCVMPPHEVQRTSFTTFRLRVADVMINAASANHPLNNIQAELIVWQQLEDELLQSPPTGHERENGHRQ